VNLGTVKSRLTRGRAALRVALVHNQALLEVAAQDAAALQSTVVQVVAA
jgi:tRNA threonylcarbamoyladenosine modification (KEOPS) complex  Pcc1 subunit